MGPELVAFLRARLDEDEHLARTASAGPWWLIRNHLQPDGTVQVRSAATEADALDGEWSLVVRLTAMPDTAVMRERMHADGRFLERFSPARALADVVARRAVVDLCERVVTAGAAPPPGAPGSRPEVSRRQRRQAVDTLRALAAVYRGHPGFRIDWADEQTAADVPAADAGVPAPRPPAPVEADAFPVPATDP